MADGKAPTPLCVLSVFTYHGVMTGAIAHEQAQRLRAAFDDVLGHSVDDDPELNSPRDVLLRLVDVLESSPDAVVFPSDAVMSTGQAAQLLGVSRMTVVRLVERGELQAAGGGAHRRIAASELARYHAARAAARTAALESLAGEIGDDTPVDQIVTTR